MNSPTRGLSTGQNPSWSLAFWNRVHRYRRLVQKFWWVLALTLSLSLFAAAWYQITRPVTYLSSASVTIDMEHKINLLGDSQNGAGNLGPDDYMRLEIPVIKSGTVQQMANESLQAKYPDMLASPVRLATGTDGAILTLMAMGSNAEYTQRYLQAIVKAYFDNRLKLRNRSGEEQFVAIRHEVDTMGDTLKADDAAINDYQHKNNVVFDKDDPNGANAALATARQKLESLKDENTQLTLMTSEQGLKGTGTGNNRQAAGGNGATAQPSPGFNVSSIAEGEFMTAKSQLVILQSQLADLSQDLRPKHPKIVALRGQIEGQEQIIAGLRLDSRKQIEDRRTRVESLIKTAEGEVKNAEKAAYDVNVLRSAFAPLREKKEFDFKHYNELQDLLAKGVSNNKIAPDPVHVVDPVSAAEAIPSSWVKMLGLALVAGLASGVGILALIDRMDDRMGSINDFQVHFSESVLGQIPRDAEVTDEDTELLRPDDPRHQLVESFRNLRSTLLYMPLEGERPKTLLVTSAVPNEGKSTLSSNLALVMAAAGMKTLLIDADLRRGAIHQKFGVTRDPGLTDVLGHNVNWKIAIRQTSVENLHVLPRGRNVPQPSEYLLNKNTDRLLQELYPLYDYIIIDSSPVLAADDTSSLAPKIDATLFVVRMGFTSAKMTRKSLEILYGRQANVPGVILNRVDTSSPEFVYYQYSEYYHTATDEDDGPGEKAKEAVKPGKPTQPTVEV